MSRHAGNIEAAIRTTPPGFPATLWLQASDMQSELAE
jgi:hypothetical protein